jgi:hypothetical protein
MVPVSLVPMVLLPLDIIIVEVDKWVETLV